MRSFSFKSRLNFKKEMSMMMTFKVSFLKEYGGTELKDLAVLAQHTQCLANEKAEAQGF